LLAICAPSLGWFIASGSPTAAFVLGCSFRKRLPIGLATRRLARLFDRKVQNKFYASPPARTHEKLTFQVRECALHLVLRALRKGFADASFQTGVVELCADYSGCGLAIQGWHGVSCKNSWRRESEACDRCR